MMGTEDAFPHLIEEEDDEIEVVLARRHEARHRKLADKNKTALGLFLGKGRRVYQAGIVPRYYRELLAWALKRYMEEEGWQAAQTLGYHGREPVYTDVNTGCGERENLLVNGQILAAKGTARLVITVDADIRGRNSILAEGPARRKSQVNDFVAGVMATARDRNFYRGKKLEFSGRLRFLEVKGRSWDSVILDESTRREIRANTIGFLARREQWAGYGIPRKRGVLLAGEPGTGKTIICKALMAEAGGVTCITTNAYDLDEYEYLPQLYDLAEDLSPSMVFIEDIDLIGQNRYEFGYQKGSTLVSLLSELDGIEEKNDIVTVATTNCLDALDAALNQRPSRFDRVIKLGRPDFDQRLELVGRLCRRIPVGATLQQHVAARTEGCTPAQIQEIIYSLVIEQADDEPHPGQFSEKWVARIISRVSGRNGHRLGFHIPRHNGAGNACTAAAAEAA